MRRLINVEKIPGRSLLAGIGDVGAVPEREGPAGNSQFLSHPPPWTQPFVPELGDEALARGARAEIARGNQTILIYQTVKILSLQLRG